MGTNSNVRDGLIEASEAHYQAMLILRLRTNLLNRVKEVSHRIEDRVQQATMSESLRPNCETAQPPPETNSIDSSF